MNRYIESLERSISEEEQYLLDIHKSKKENDDWIFDVKNTERYIAKLNILQTIALELSGIVFRAYGELDHNIYDSIDKLFNFIIDNEYISGVLTGGVVLDLINEVINLLNDNYLYTDEAKLIEKQLELFMEVDDEE